MAVGGACRQPSFGTTAPGTQPRRGNAGCACPWDPQPLSRPRNRHQVWGCALEWSWGQHVGTERALWYRTGRQRTGRGCKGPGVQSSCFCSIRRDSPACGGSARCLHSCPHPPLPPFKSSLRPGLAHWRAWGALCCPPGHSHWTVWAPGQGRLGTTSRPGSAGALEIRRWDMASTGDRDSCDPRRP